MVDAADLRSEAFVRAGSNPVSGMTRDNLSDQRGSPAWLAGPEIFAGVAKLVIRGRLKICWGESPVRVRVPSPV